MGELGWIDGETVKRVAYRFNLKLTAESVERALQFLDAHLRAPSQKP